MRINRIFTNSDIQANSSVTLDEKASHHLSKVLRQKVGAKLIVFNGDGLQYQATIEAIQKKSVLVTTETAETQDRESPLKIHLGIAISKGDRMDWVMQKTTELGIAIITPLFSERTEVKLKGERLEKKLQHWRQICVSACEQCGRNQLPQLNPLQNIDDWVNTVNANKKFVLHHRSEKNLDPQQKYDSIALLIGPEGGLSEAEIAFAYNNQFEPLCLGPRVMRTETAPLAAIAIMQNLWGDL